MKRLKSAEKQALRSSFCSYRCDCSWYLRDPEPACRTAEGFVEELPGLWKAMESDISNAGSSLESSHYFSPNVQEQVARILNSLMKLLSSAVDHMGSPTVSAVGNFAKNIPTIIVGVIMCLLSSYFFVAQREEVIAAFRRYVPENFRKKWDVMYHSLTGCHWRIFQSTAKDRDLGISSDAGRLFDPAGALRCADFDRDCDPWIFCRYSEPVRFCGHGQ